MTYNYKVTKDQMNKIFYSIYDRYGYKNAPYEHGEKRTTKIEICGWRYHKEFIKKLLLENDLTVVDLGPDDTIFMDCYEDLYKN